MLHRRMSLLVLLPIILGVLTGCAAQPEPSAPDAPTPTSMALAESTTGPTNSRRQEVVHDCLIRFDSGELRVEK